MKLFNEKYFQAKINKKYLNNILGAIMTAILELTSNDIKFPFKLKTISAA